jgi:hypothetical protein
MTDFVTSEAAKLHQAVEPTTDDPRPAVSLEEVSPPLTEAPPVGDDTPHRGTLTLAHGLLLLAGVLAAILRFSSLATTPLSPEEAQQAFLVWQFWQPAGLAEANALLGDFLNAGSPAYFAFTSPLMLILGSSDVVMRLVPAFFGVLTVLLPWFMRDRLGTAGAIVAAFLLAVSPLMASVSRTAGGDAIALFAIFLLAIAWLRFASTGRSEWFYTLMAALGLGLCSSSLFYTGLVTFALALFIHRRFGPDPSPTITRPDRTTWRTGLIIGGTTFVGLATLFLFNLAGLGAAFALLGDWFSAFSLQGGVLDWLAPVFLVLRYEPALLILGVVSLAWATWRGSAFPSLLSFWFTSALLLAILLHTESTQVMILILVGYLLIGTWANAILSTPVMPEPDPTLPVSPTVLRWGTFVLLLAAGATFYFNLIRHLREIVFSTDNISYLLIAIFAVFMAIALVNFVRVFSRPVAYQATILALLFLFGFYSWGTAWWLTHEGAADPRERWVAATTDPGVLLLQEVLSETSFQLDNAVDSLEVAVAVNHPALRWYLREFDNALFGQTIPGTTTAEALITPAGESLNLSTDYFGADFYLLRFPSPETNIQCPARGNGTGGSSFICTAEHVLRWWLFHDSPDPIIQENIIFWVRTDLTLEDR